MTRALGCIALAVGVLVCTANASAQAIASCNADKIKTAMNACDSLVNISQIKCDNAACHKALHMLVDDDTIACYEELKLGNKTDLFKYKELDEFCHGEGHDPDEHDHDHAHKTKGNETTTGSAENHNATVTTKPSTVLSPTPQPTSIATSVAWTATIVTFAVGTTVLF